MLHASRNDVQKTEFFPSGPASIRVRARLSLKNVV